MPEPAEVDTVDRHDCLGIGNTSGRLDKSDD
jgi:hypothetical protein